MGVYHIDHQLTSTVYITEQELLRKINLNKNVCGEILRDYVPSFRDVLQENNTFIRLLGQFIQIYSYNYSTYELALF